MNGNVVKFSIPVSHAVGPDDTYRNFKDAPNSMAKWKVECMLVDAKQTYKDLTRFNEESGGQSYAMHKVANVIDNLNELIKLFNEELKAGKQ